MHIYIPSRSRFDCTSTWDLLPEKWKARCHIVIHPSQRKDYSVHYDSSRLLVCPENGIAKTRQWIMENTPYAYVCFLDDDMYFSIRTGGGVKLRRCEEHEIHSLLKLLYNWLKKDGFAHVGVSRRGGNNCVTAPWEEITRMNNIYAFDVKKFHESGARFDRLPVMEDFDCTLSMLKAGFPNRVTYKYAWGQKMSGMEGGCSDYRTGEIQKQAAFNLAQLHPGLVTVKAKKSKTAWKGVGTIRTDVIIHWKKAYKPVRSKKNGIAGFLNG